MDSSARKDTLRRLILARRSKLDQAEREERGAAISARLLALPEIADARSIVGFVSVRSEVPLLPVLQAALESGTTLLLPYVSEEGVIRAAPVGSLSELEPGYRGIPEPRARFPVDPSSAGAIVVPGVAFDEAGGRLGYGGGFYDRFLEACGSVPRIGVCFELQLIDEVPMTDRDARVDAIVTEERVVRVARKSG